MEKVVCMSGASRIWIVNASFENINVICEREEAIQQVSNNNELAEAR